MRLGSKTRLKNRWLPRRRRNGRLGFAAVLSLILVAAAVALLEYGDSFPSEDTEQPQQAEQPQSEPPLESPLITEPDGGLGEAWATAVAQDASPSLAAPGETAMFGRRIALTFDYGPDPSTTPAILDVLRDYHLKATFFVIGARAEQDPELIERIVSEGHTLGNHTYYHRDLTKLPPELRGCANRLTTFLTWWISK